MALQLNSTKQDLTSPLGIVYPISDSFTCSPSLSIAPAIWSYFMSFISCGYLMKRLYRIHVLERCNFKKHSGNTREDGKNKWVPHALITTYSIWSFSRWGNVLETIINPSVC